MPPIISKPKTFNNSRDELFRFGCERARLFCATNDVNTPRIVSAPKESWGVDACAYYRENLVRICLPECANLATEAQARNWNWPGSTTDREPYGVICHEVAHHCDRSVSSLKSSYGGNYSKAMRERSGEAEITSYCPNDWEWFAEMFRVFITNAYLLKLLRPKTFECFTKRWKPVSSPNWKHELGTNVPPRIVANLEKKIRDAKR